jgi:hypothetical protein
VKEKLLVLSICFFSMHIAAFAADEKSLIAKCGFEGGNQISVGSPYLYVFGKRKINGDHVVVENFEVQHELAQVEDDINSDLLPNLDKSRIFPASFKIDEFTHEEDLFGVRWNHPPIEGRTESIIPSIFAYADKDKRVVTISGVWSALAYSKGFTGAYAICRNLGLVK